MKTLETRLEGYDSHMTLRNFSANTKGMYLRTIRLFFEFRKSRKTRGRLKKEEKDKRAYLEYFLDDFEILKLEIYHSDLIHTFNLAHVIVLFCYEHGDFTVCIHK